MVKNGFSGSLSAGKGLLLLVLALFLGGCASTRHAACPQDPLEGFNRAMFQVHDGIDTVLLRPVAQGYDAVMPDMGKTGVSNFFSNLWEISRGANAFLQAKPEEGLDSFARLMINSTIGLGGLLDVATEMGIDQGDEDFGQTLAVWGVGNGPYLFVPVLGPSTARDLVGVYVDQYYYPAWYHVDHVRTRNSLLALRMVDARADLLPADRLIADAALDRYAYIRAAYFQRRRTQVYDGNPPPDDGACGTEP